MWSILPIHAEKYKLINLAMNFEISCSGYIKATIILHKYNPFTRSIDCIKTHGMQTIVHDNNLYTWYSLKILYTYWLGMRVIHVATNTYWLGMRAIATNFVQRGDINNKWKWVFVLSKNIKLFQINQWHKQRQ